MVHEHYGQSVKNGTHVANEETGFHNDVCMVYLDEPFVLNGHHVDAVAGLTNYTVLAGEMCVVAGWGLTRVSK